MSESLVPKIIFCNAKSGWCWNGKNTDKGGEGVAEEIAASEGKTLEALFADRNAVLDGNQVTLEKCDTCLRGCGMRPRVDIETPGKVSRISATSLTMLTGALKKHLSE